MSRTQAKEKRVPSFGSDVVKHHERIDHGPFAYGERPLTSDTGGDSVDAAVTADGSN